MKRIDLIIVCIICSLVLFLGVNRVEKQVSLIQFSFDSQGQYRGFNNLPLVYTLETAIKDGCFVTQDSEVIANESVWDNFRLVSSQRKNIAMRMVLFYSENDEGPYFIDLFYEDGYYYLFDSSSENLAKKPFEYLLKLEGQFGKPLRDTGVILLTNDNSLTFNTVMASMISSSSEFIHSVPEYRLIMFL